METRNIDWIMTIDSVKGGQGGEEENAESNVGNLDKE